MELDINFWWFVAIVISIPSGITIPVTVFLQKLKNKDSEHDVSIAGLKDEIRQLDTERKDDRRELKADLTKLHDNILALQMQVNESQNKQQQFFIDWNQRIEDRIESLRQEIMNYLRNNG